MEKLKQNSERYGVCEHSRCSCEYILLLSHLSQVVMSVVQASHAYFHITCDCCLFLGREESNSVDVWLAGSGKIKLHRLIALQAQLSRLP